MAITYKTVIRFILVKDATVSPALCTNTFFGQLQELQGVLFLWEM